MSDFIFVSIYVVALIVGIISIISTIYYAYKCWNEMTPSAGKLVNFIPFIIIFFPTSYNEAGKKYYDRWAMSMFIVLLSFSVLFILDGLAVNETSPNK